MAEIVIKNQYQLDRIWTVHEIDLDVDNNQQVVRAVTYIKESGFYTERVVSSSEIARYPMSATVVVG